MWERTCVRRRPRPLERPPVRGAWRGRRSTVQRLPRAGGLGTKSGPLRRPLVVLLVATGRDQLRARTASVRSAQAGHTPGRPSSARSRASRWRPRMCGCAGAHASPRLPAGIEKRVHAHGLRHTSRRRTRLRGDADEPHD